MMAMNAGISAFVDGNGCLRTSTRRYAADTVLVEVGRDTRSSWYLAHGDWLARCCLAACVFLASVPIAGRHRQIHWPGLADGCEIVPVMYRSTQFTLVFFGVFATVDCMATTCVWYYYLCLKGVVIDARLLAWTPACCLMVVLGAKVFHWAAQGRKFLVEPSKYLGETGYYVQGGILGTAVWIL